MTTPVHALSLSLDQQVYISGPLYKKAPFGVSLFFLSPFSRPQVRGGYKGLEKSD
jgi:hypothetical protein